VPIEITSSINSGDWLIGIKAAKKDALMGVFLTSRISVGDLKINAGYLNTHQK
jgi:hypothetical protein